MHGFWTDILARWPGIFEGFVKKWKFWAGVLGPILLLYLARYKDAWDAAKEQWYVIGGPLGVSGFYALIKAIEAHYEDLEKRHVAHGDQMTEIKERALRDRRAVEAQLKTAQDEAQRLEGELATALRLGTEKVNERAKRLLELQQAGILLRQAVEKTFLPDKHKAEYGAWLSSVGEYVQAEFPTRFNALFLPPQIPKTYQGPPDRSYIMVKIEDVARQIQVIIDEMRQRD